MITSLNKAVKMNIVDSAIADKFKEQFEKARRVFEVATRDFAMINSQHVQFNSLNLPPEMMGHVKSKSHIELNRSIKSDIDFIGQIYSVSFDSVVYAYSGNYYIHDEDVKELAALRELVKTIGKEYVALRGVIMSYKSVKKLVADLPWVKQYLPVEQTSTGLIAVDILNDINAKFGK